MRMHNEIHMHTDRAHSLTHNLELNASLFQMHSVLYLIMIMWYRLQVYACNAAVNSVAMHVKRIQVIMF